MQVISISAQATSTVCSMAQNKELIKQNLDFE